MTSDWGGMGSQLNQNIRSYQLVERIGKGGFGEVYRAYQSTVGREVAIKVIMPQHANRPDFIRNFEAEAKMVARLEHPFIVPLFDYWREPEGAYLVMRYLRGGTLKQEMTDGAMPVLRVADVLDNLCSALWTSHRNRVAHRDIKPANIMLDDEQRAYLSDFGLAITIGEDHFENLVGTWLYMPPERIQNQKQTHTVDVYSLGVMTYQMLTGEYPFDRTTMKRLAQNHISAPLPPIELYRDDIPVELNMVLQRATSKDPDARYEDIRVFAQDFREIAQPMGTISDRTMILPKYEETINPYMGLRPFLEADSEYFFGRVALTQKLIDRLDEDTFLANFLALVGPSGSGKSSVIYAGLIPELKRGAILGSEHWYYAKMTPGSQPFQNLLLALRSVSAVAIDDITQKLMSNANALNEFVPTLLGDANSTLFLFIDQFEELFTQLENKDERQEFLDLLTTTVTSPETHVRIIITMRADFYDKPLRYEKFGKLMQYRTEVILPLDTTELERVIAGPAYQVGLEVEPELIAEIITDVKSEPGALPLLQYTLTELFTRSGGTILTLLTYHESGGVRGSLARRADAVYESIPDDHRRLAHQIFLRLVTLGEGAEDTRRRARLSELRSIADDADLVETVLEEFNQYRLLTFDRDPETREPTVEVAHEALIREWQQFRRWLDASRDDLRLQRLIATEVADWNENGRDASYLVRGNRLAHFEHWADSTNIAISPAEQDFILASIKEQKREQQEQRAHLQLEMKLMQQSGQRLRFIIVLLLIVTVGGILLFGAIFRQNQEIQVQRDNALASQGEAEFNLQTAYSAVYSATAEQAIGEGDYGLALAFALKALQLNELSPVAHNTLVKVTYASGISQIIDAHAEPIYKVILSSDGQIAASVGGASYAELVEELEPMEVQDRDQPLDFSLIDFDSLSSSAIQIWGTQTGELITEFSGHNSTVTSIGFVPTQDSTALPTMAYSASVLGEAMIWDINSGEIIQQLESLPAGYNRLSMSRDGTLLGSNGSDVDYDGNRLVLWDMESGDIRQTFTPHASGLWDSQIYGDGRQAISIYLDGSQVLWDTETGEILTDTQLDDEIRAASFGIELSNNNDIGITNLGSGEVYIWEIEDNEFEMYDLAFSLSDVPDIALSGDGERLLILQPNAEFVDWSVVDQVLNEIIEERGAELQSVDISTDGNTAIIGRVDGSILVWDLTNTDPLIAQTFDRLDTHLRATFLPLENEDDEQRLLVFDGDFNDENLLDSTLSIWGVESGRQQAKWETPHTLLPDYLTVDKSGTTAITVTRPHPAMPEDVSQNSKMILWNLEDGSIRQEIDLDYVVGEVQFVPNSVDPIKAVTGWQDGVALWDMEAGVVSAVYGASSATSQVAITPDSRYIFSVDADGQLIQWDFESGEVVMTQSIGVGSEVFEVEPTKMWIATGYNEKDIAIWNYDTHELVTILEGYTGKVLSADFTYSTEPDSSEFLQMVSSDMDGNIAYWNMDDFSFTGSWFNDSSIHIEISDNGIYHTIVPAVGILEVLYLEDVNDQEIYDFIDANRVVHQVTIQDCRAYNIEELCIETDIIAPES